jgi:CCR4-NOT transcription complex subunit 6
VKQISQVSLSRFVLVEFNEFIPKVQACLDVLKSYNLPVIFCGDFNSVPGSPVYNLITKGKYTPRSGQLVVPEGVILPYDKFKHGLGLESCYYAAKSEEPEVTSVCGGVPPFAETIDYIFVTKQAFSVKNTLNLPSRSDCLREQGLPDVSHPSDHLPIGAALSFTG